MFHDPSRKKLLTVNNAAFAAFALYCVVQHLFAYNFAVGNVQYIPLMLGSYLYMTYLVGGAFLLRPSLQPLPAQVLKELIFITSFFAYTVMVVLICDDLAQSYRDLGERSVLRINLNYLVGHMLAFAVGFYLRGLNRFKTLIVSGFVLLVVNTLVNIDAKTLMLNLNVKDEQFSGIYLMLGDTFGLWAALTCAVVVNRWSRLTVVSSAVVSLMLLNSRTSLYSFIVMTPFVFRMSLRRAVVLLAAIAALVVASVTFPVASQQAVVNRMFSSVIAGEDSSANSRIIQFQSGLRGIADNLILGDYAGQVREFGEVGAYIHNVLSYWRQFGLVPFLMVLVLWGRAAKRAKGCLVSDEEWVNPDNRFFVLSFVFLGVEALTSRSYGYSLQWLLLGQSTALLGSWSQRPVANLTTFGAMASDNSALLVRREV